MLDRIERYIYRGLFFSDHYREGLTAYHSVLRFSWRPPPIDRYVPSGCVCDIVICCSLGPSRTSTTHFSHACQAEILLASDSISIFRFSRSNHDIHMPVIYGTSWRDRVLNGNTRLAGIKSIVTKSSTFLEAMATVVDGSSSSSSSSNSSRP